jgi:hypothetical protein
MSDSYGSDLDAKVLNYEDCSWDTAFLLRNRALLGSDLSLLGQISAYKDQQALKAQGASGFLDVGSIRHVTSLDAALLEASSGDVITSTELLDSFYLASRSNGCWAIVNGWLVNVSSNLVADSVHNWIKLITDSVNSTNLVFLEVWKAVVEGDVGIVQGIKKFGNQETLLTIPNDIYQQSINMETARRVQVQYRIRVEDVSTSVHAYPDGFSSAVKSRGARGNVSTLTYTSMSGEGDAGLYRAGNGGTDKDVLGTVDGYSYAIPMFLVSRRKNDENFTYDPSDTTKWNLSRNQDAVNSMRPDGLFANVVYSSDIVDLRYKLVDSKDSLKEVLENTLTGIASGTLATTKGRLTDGTGGLMDYSSGGTQIIKSDKITKAGTGDANINQMATLLSGTPRRSFLSGLNTQTNNAWKITWVLPPTGQDRRPYAVVNFSSYGADAYILRDPSNYVLLSDDSGVLPSASYALEVGTSSLKIYWGHVATPTPSTPPTNAFLKYDLSWDSKGQVGFSDVPVKMLEQRYYKQNTPTTGKVQLHANAVPGEPLYLYGSHPFYLGVNDRIECIGTSVKDLSNFGQVAFLNLTIGLSDTAFYIQLAEGMSLPRVNPFAVANTDTYYGQKVLGVRSVHRKLTTGEFSDSYVPNVNFQMDFLENLIKVVPSVPMTDETNEVEISLYLGTKFSVLNKEANGAADTFETAYLPVTRIGSTSKYFVETSSKQEGAHQQAIVSLCSVLRGDVTNPTSVPYVLIKGATLGTDIWDKNDTSGLADNVLGRYPISKYDSVEGCSPVRIQWNNQTAFPGSLSANIKVGVHMFSWLKASEDESIYYTYNTTGYQGLKPAVTPLKGDILVEGDALITSRGTGSSLEETYRVDNVTLEISNNLWKFILPDGSLFVNGQVAAGDYLRLDDYTSRKDDWFTSLLRVAKVEPSISSLGVNCTLVTFVDTFTLPVGVTSGGNLRLGGTFLKANTYADGMYGLIARMPSASKDAFKYYGAELNSEGTTTAIAPVGSSGRSHRMARTGGVRLASGSQVLRGSYDLTIQLNDGVSKEETVLNEVFTRYPGVVTNPWVAYKVLQPYLFREASSGRMFLAVVSSDYTSGKLNASTSPYKGIDVVDIFELKGRYLSRGNV